jgi:phosphoribosylformimino-5-aminoimidazole carboxamide ribonucleotide (ProFAR) isomerase
LHLHLFFGCKTVNSLTTIKKQVQVVINLNEIKDDKVMVTVNAPSITTDEITYILKQFQEPTQKTIMEYIEDLKAYDAKGTLLTVKKLILILGPFLKQRPLKNYLFSK